jgi:hypothetical protein
MTYAIIYYASGPALPILTPERKWLTIEPIHEKIDAEGETPPHKWKGESNEDE